MDWLDLLAVQGTPKSLLQNHSSKASILRHSAFFSPTLTSIHDYWKNHSRDYRTFSGIMSLLFNTLSRFVIAFLPRRKSLNFVTAVTVHIDFGAQENEMWHSFHFFPIYLPWSDRTGCHDLHFLKVELYPEIMKSDIRNWGYVWGWGKRWGWERRKGPDTEIHFCQGKDYDFISKLVGNYWIICNRKTAHSCVKIS